MILMIILILMCNNNINDNIINSNDINNDININNVIIWK